MCESLAFLCFLAQMTCIFRSHDLESIASTSVGINVWLLINEVMLAVPLNLSYVA